MNFTFVDDYDFLAAHKIDEAIPWAMLKGNDYGMMSVKQRQSDRRGSHLPPARDDGARHARLVAHGAAGAPRQSALHDQAGAGSDGARRLA